MKTITIEAFEFNELSEDAKQYAIRKNYTINEDTVHHFYNDAYETVKKFNELFNIKEGRNSWLDYSISHIDDEILELSNDKLKEYINSRIDIENYQNCLLTGVCYDINILEPIYRPDKNQTFEDCIELCFKALEKSLNNEQDYFYSEDAIIEAIRANEFIFTKEGIQIKL